MDDRDILDAHVATFQIKKERTVKGLFKEVVDFLIHDGTVLFRVLSIYSLPLFLFTAFAAYFFLDTNTKIENVYYLKDHLLKSRYIFLIVNTLLYIAGIGLMTFATNLLLILKDNEVPENRSHLFREFRKEIVLRFKNYAVNFLIVFVMYYLLCYVVVFLEGLTLFTNDGGLDFSPFNSEMNLVYKIIVSLLFMPMILYYGFSSLFVSLRDNIGATEALPKIHSLSLPNLKKIWIASTLMYFTGSAILGCISYLMNFSAGFSGATPFVFFFIFLIQKLIMFGMFVLMAIGSVLLFGSLEHAKDNTHNEAQGSETAIN